MERDAPPAATRRTLKRLLTTTVLALAGMTTNAAAQLNVITVDCTPFVSPNITSFGPDNTMGMALLAVDQGGDFNVTEVTPAMFRGMTAAQLGMYDLIAINNNPTRIDCGSGLGLGSTWHSVIGVQQGGRVVLNSHDAARFKMIIPPGAAFFGAGAPGPGVEPFGADELVRQAALWAGGGQRTGLLIFNDSARFFTVGGQGWNNPELNLPAPWGISDADQTGGAPTDGGYTDILPAYHGHPIYSGLSDARFGIDSVASFAANIADGSFHSVFASYNAGIFTPTEVVVNAGIIDVGGFNAAFGIGSNTSPVGPNGLAISLIRNQTLHVEIDIKPGSDPNGVNPRSKGVIPVAILTTSIAMGDSIDFDAATVDPATVTFGPGNATIVHPGGHLEDVDLDGDVDLVLHFKTPHTGIACGDNQATLNGQTSGGDNISGHDMLKIAGCK